MSQYVVQEDYSGVGNCLRDFVCAHLELSHRARRCFTLDPQRSCLPAAAGARCKADRGPDSPTTPGVKVPSRDRVVRSLDRELGRAGYRAHDQLDRRAAAAEAHCPHELGRQSGPAQTTTRGFLGALGAARITQRFAQNPFRSLIHHRGLELERMSSACQRCVIVLPKR
jgi:hypothetical protein